MKQQQDLGYHQQSQLNRRSNFDFGTIIMTYILKLSKTISIFNSFLNVIKWITFCALIQLLFGCNFAIAVRPSNPYIDPGCPRISLFGGKVRGDLLHRRESVEKISLIVIRDFYGYTDRKATSGVEVIDMGRYWQVTETLKRNLFGTNIKFRVDKCNGAISNLEGEE